MNPFEVESIIKAASEPYKHQVDIAKQYKVSVQLVGRLVKKSVEAPEKIAYLHHKAELEQRKKDAVESVATEWLA